MDNIYKVVVVGDVEVGRLTNLGNFEGTSEIMRNHELTEIPFSYKKNNITISINNYIYPSDDRKEFTQPLPFYKNTSLVIFLYDNYSIKSLEGLEVWFQQIISNLRFFKKNFKIILIGNSRVEADSNKKKIDKTELETYTATIKKLFDKSLEIQSVDILPENTDWFFKIIKDHIKENPNIIY